MVDTSKKVLKSLRAGRSASFLALGFKRAVDFYFESAKKGKDFDLITRRVYLILKYAVKGIGSQQPSSTCNVIPEKQVKEAEKFLKAFGALESFSEAEGTTRQNVLIQMNPFKFESGEIFSFFLRVYFEYKMGLFKELSRQY